MSSLASMLEESATLEDLNLAGNQFSERGAAKLAQGLIMNSRLNGVDLTGNPFTCLGAEVIAEALTGLPRWKYAPDCFCKCRCSWLLWAALDCYCWSSCWS